MDSQNPQDYHALCRGAATYILLGSKINLGMTVQEIATACAMDPARVLEDIDAIVQLERHKAGGVFEAKNAPLAS